MVFSKHDSCDNKNWEKAFHLLPDNTLMIHELLRSFLTTNANVVDSIIREIEQIGKGIPPNNYKDQIVSILAFHIDGNKGKYLRERARRSFSECGDKDGVYDPRLFTSLWKCAKSGIPISIELRDLFLTNIDSQGIPQNEREIFFFNVVKSIYPDALLNVLMGDVELDIYIPSKKMNIEIDSKNSPKTLKKKKLRDSFLRKYFGIIVERFVYDRSFDGDDVKYYLLGLYSR